MMLSFFNGKKSLEQAIFEISSFFDLPEKNISNLISIYIENKKEVTIEYEGQYFEFPKNVLIENKNGNFCNYNPEEFIIEGELDLITERLFLPLDLTFMVTNKCITNCVYCYADRKTNYLPLNFEQIIKIIKESKDIKIRNFDLNGGELFLYENWFELLENLTNNGFYPYISTKIPINIDTIKKIKKLGFTTIQFSIDSLNVNVLKKTLGVADNYIIKLKETIINCKKENLKIRINTVITNINSNIEELNKLILFLSKFDNIEHVNITMAGYSIYLGEEKYKNYRANRDDILKIEQFVKKIKYENIINIDFNGYAQIDEYINDDVLFKRENFSKRAKCTGNIENFYILPDGKVTICEELYWNSNFIIGDLTKQSIMEVWNSSKAMGLFNLSKEMVQDKSKCKICKEFENCHKVPGVCWKLVVEAYGNENWTYPDPRCPYSPPPQNVFFIE